MDRPLPLQNKGPDMGHTIFMDRDGIINEDSPAYIKHASEFYFIPKSPQAIALLTHYVNPE